MSDNFSSKDLNRPMCQLCLYTFIAIALVGYGGYVTIMDAITNGLSTERVTQFYGGWVFFIFSMLIGVFLIFYIISYVRVIIFRIKQDE